MVEDQIFISALDLSKHPMLKVKQPLQDKYYGVLEYYVSQCTDSIIVLQRLALYKKLLLKVNNIIDYKKCEDAIIKCRYQPWRNKYKCWIICDLYLIFNDFNKCQKAIDMVINSASIKQVRILKDLLSHITSHNDPIITDKYKCCYEMLQQCKRNYKFFLKNEKRIVITANMSAGKSTLINAIIGKDLARTSQEACTGNICYFYNKPFDDGTVHFQGKHLNLSASESDYKLFDWDSEIRLATWYKACFDTDVRVCLVDTPGVNSAIRREHGNISKKCISKGEYDQVFYILNAGKIGTDEEFEYLKWISKNVPSEKIVFVLNKLDDFKKDEDNITLSVAGVRNDLEKLGYNNPKVYPVSAYFAYLLKQAEQNKIMSDDELDELNLLKKKFLKPEYNLSAYYESVELESGYEGYLKRSGFYYLEKELYGGN